MQRIKNFFAISVLFFLTLLFSQSFAQYTWVDTTDSEGSAIRMEVNDKTGAPHRLYGLKVNFNNRYGHISEQNVQGLSRQFLTEYAKLLKIQPGALKFESTVNNKGRWYVNFQQQYRGVPVYRANVGFTIHENGNVVLVGSDVYPDISIDVTPAISSDEALKIAQSNFVELTGTDSLVVRKEPELIILPPENEKDFSYLLSYRVELEYIDSVSVFSEGYFIDAKKGDIVKQYSNIRDASIWGTVNIKYWPQHYYDSQSTDYYKKGKIKLYTIAGYLVGTKYTNSSGYYNYSNLAYGVYIISAGLEGSYVKLYNNSELHQTTVVPGSHNWTWNATDATNVYYHADWIHDFFKGAPFYYNGMNYQMKAYVNKGSSYNGYATGNDIGFGSQNGQYWARSSDVVYHEYTHCVIYHLYGNRWIGDDYYGEGRAMDEGLADYFAISINDDPVQGESVGVNRDHSVNHTMSQYNNIPGYPDVPQGAHLNGLIIGGACWDLREDLGMNYVNELVFDALQMTPHAYNFEDFALNIAIADDNDGNLNNSVPHYYDIKEAFETNHGISFNVPAPAPLSVTISGPTHLNSGQTGTFTANPSGGSGTYTNYQWWYRNDEDGGPLEPLQDKNITPLAPPHGVWIYLSQWEGEKTITYGASFDFSLKCKVTDSDGNTATDIHSVIVGGLAKGITEQNTNAAFKAIPKELTLTGNYPNPFNPTTTIKFGLPEAAHVEIFIYSITGERISTLVSENLPAGYHEVQWNGTDRIGNKVASGIYIYELKTDSKRLVKKMLLAK